MKKFVLLFVLVVRLSFVHAQNTYPDAKECYPDCNFTFQEIENELRPTFSSSNIIDAKAIEIIAKKMEQFRTEDANKFHLLKNKYCAALNGWIQNGECLHGGPPPCCNSPAGVVPWKRIGADKAKTALYAEWHQTRDKRNKDMELEVRNGYEVSRAQLFTQFNALYKQSTECTKILRDDAAYYKKNAVAVNQYIARMSNLYAEMKGYIDIKLSSAQQVQNVQFTTTEMEKLGTEICKAREEVFAGKVYDPLLTQHNNLYSEFPFQKETLSRAKVDEAVSKSSASNLKSTETPVDVTNEQNALASNEAKPDVDFSQPTPIVRSKSVKVDPKQEIKKEIPHEITKENKSADSKNNKENKSADSKNKVAVNKNIKENKDTTIQENKSIEMSKTTLKKIDDLQKDVIKIKKEVVYDGDKDEFMYLRLGLGLNYQRIPTLQNTIYLDKAAQTQVHNFDAYGLTANLKFAVLNNQLVSVIAEPFASYSWHFDVSSQFKKIFDKKTQADTTTTSKSVGNDLSAGGTISIGYALGKQLGLEDQDLRIFLKGGYTYRKGNDTFALIDINTPANTRCSETQYAYSTLKLGVGLYYGFGTHKQSVEVSAFKEYPSFFPSIKSNFFNYNIFSFEAKLRFLKGILAIQYANNYPIAGTVSYKDNFTKTNSDLWVVSLTYPINIFSINSKN